jgi:DNA modification methylase
VSVRILRGDALAKLAELPAASVHCCVTSPPYFGLRDYGCDGQIGLEATPDEYVCGLVAVFREVRRVLRSDGTLWLNIGDSYATSSGKGSNVPQTNDAAPHRAFRAGNVAKNNGNSNRNGICSVPSCKPKDLIGIPWMLAFALRADGWYLRQDIIWSKPNPMPESVTDRPTRSHEYLFLLTKSARYFYDHEAIAEPATMKPQARLTPRDFVNGKDAGRAAHRRPDYRIRDDAEQENATRNKRSVWEIVTKPFSEAHFATFPPALVEPCILAGCPMGGTVLDPFAGAGTTGLVADRLGRNAILIELNPEYAAMAHRRIVNDAPLFAEVAASERTAGRMTAAADD